MPKFRALQTAYCFDKKHDCDRLVQVGEIIESDLELDADLAIPAGEAPDCRASKVFQRVEGEA